MFTPGRVINDNVRESVSMQVNNRNAMSYPSYILLSDTIKLITEKLSIMFVESDYIQIPAQHYIIF